MHAREIIEKFGGQSALAELIGKGQSTVAYWAKTGAIPTKWQPKLLMLALNKGLPLTASDFVEVPPPRPLPAPVVAPAPQEPLSPLDHGEVEAAESVSNNMVAF
jgi:hypothetical protein